MVNKSHCGFFDSSCGLRQGDPLSPCLSILAEEILSLSVQDLHLKKLIHSVSRVASTPCLLLYADDLLFFLRAKNRNRSILRALLLKYQNAEGQHFNLSTSHLFFGKCNHKRRRIITSLHKITVSSSPTVYLGISPLLWLSEVQSFC